MALWRVWIDENEIIYGVYNEAVVRAGTREVAKAFLVDSWGSDVIKSQFPQDKIHAEIIDVRGEPGIISATEQA